MGGNRYRILVMSLIAALLFIPIVTDAAYHGGQHNNPGSEFVSIQWGGFHPGTVVIRPGERVVWINRIPRHQQLVFRGMMVSPVIRWGERWSYVFWRPGEYNYYLASNRSVRGKIIVRRFR